MTAQRGHGVGILAMETYVASRYVAQEALEKADGVSAGKYTVVELTIVQFALRGCGG